MAHCTVLKYYNCLATYIAKYTQSAIYSSLESQSGSLFTVLALGKLIEW